jgi:ribonucleoside-diphosphate reductase alpha chain
MAQAVSTGVQRFFTTPKSTAYEMFTWVKRDSVIMNPMTGKPVFEQRDAEFPESWSMNAINIVAQKYFAGAPGTPQHETSLKQLVDRVVDTITRHGLQEGYFENETEAETFREELKYICVSQRAAFNSPVWFNIGFPGRAQQASACFILAVEDSMTSILNWYVEEGMIFKGGSGAGINLSPIRSSQETLGGSKGTASGPVSFMRGADSSAGAIKSGGKTRRAAKMVILNVDHPDIQEFIWCKAREERKSRVLQAAGFDMDLDGKDAFSVQYQNANNSVRVTDDFMKAVAGGEDWNLLAIKDGRSVKTLPARELWREIAEAAWECADPGLQFDTTINHWHTTPNAGRINASNPCSEYMHLDNSACNLASLNLLRFLKDDNSFDVEAFRHAVEVLFMAQEILVGKSEYPTTKIGKNARAYRELGIGYANLGALLMAQGLPYDSEEGRAQAAAITALMTGHAYVTSAKMSRRVGPFAGFHKDREGMLKILRQHRSEVKHINPALCSEELLSAAQTAWDEAVELGEMYGIRNSQASVLAPTGTIGFMMDCDTTGIEPDLGLVKHKKLVGGGTMSIVNQTVPRALSALGYTKKEADDIVAYIDVEKTIVGAPALKSEHLPVFACSMGDNTIHYEGHVRMMGAVQPFISGAISKTVNMPEEVTVEDVADIHMLSWKLGLKAVAIYRDNCKVAQPLSMAKKAGAPAAVAAAEPAVAATAAAALAPSASSEAFAIKPGSMRRHMPKKRAAFTYRFSVGGVKGFFTVGEFEDGTPGELFVQVAKQGSTLAGVMDAFAISISYGLQHGVPLKNYVHGLSHMSFAPGGMTDDPEIRTASSIVDYIFHRLALDYLSFDDRLELGLASIEDMPEGQVSFLEQELANDPVPETPEPATVKLPEIPTIAEAAVEPQPSKTEKKTSFKDASAPMCYNCGNQTQKAGSCYVCTSCGSTTGCS